MSEDLERTLNEAWDMLGRFAEAGGGFAALATCDAAGAPQVRTVALRQAARGAGRVEIFTDALSCKIHEIRSIPNVSLLLLDPELAVQVRLAGRAEILTGAAVSGLWQEMPPEGRLNYSHQPPPGTRIESPGAYAQRPQAGRFAVIRIAAAHIDHVSLEPAGHRRAAFAAEDGWRGQWLSP